MIPKEQKEIIELIDNSIDDFMADIPDTQKKSFNKLLELTKELEVQDGSIKNNLNNIKLLGKIRKEMDAILLNKPYIKKVSNFVKAYDKVSKLNNDYYASLNDRWTPNSVLKAVKQINIEYTIEQLTENGLAAKYSDAVKGILKTNITSGGSYADMLDQLKTTMLGTDGKEDGFLNRYGKQIVTDSISQYNRQYNKAVTDDLGFEWFAYSGSLRTTSREFCIHLENRMFFHKSEVPDLLNGVIGDDIVELSEKTGLPNGFIEGTNEDTFFSNAGGYNCNHIIYGVAEELVPKKLRDEILSSL